MTLRRKLSTEERAQVERYQQQEETARKLRHSAPRFRATFSLAALRDELPLPFPTKAEFGEQPRFRALSWYVYPGWTALTDLKQLAVMSAFFIALHLIDFSPLRAELVARTAITPDGPGQTPFDPVSLFLCCLLRLEKGLGWESLADFLAGPEGACWRRLLGFHDRTPGESTMRGFQNSLGVAFDADLCPRFIELLHAAGLLPDSAATSSLPGLPVAADGMLHESHSSMRCSKVTDTCYRPTSPHSPRPCPAREEGREGCTCSEDACAQVCRRATPRDAEARLIHYSGSNQHGKQDPDRARNVYGYRSYAQVICDDDLHLSWIAHTSVHAANTDERGILPADFAHLRERLPHISISQVIADAAAGFENCLDAVYDAHAIPIIAIRRDPSDEDERACAWRGYDENGHPLCAHGHPMSFNGVDYRRLRACWACRQICSRLPEPKPEDAACPFRDPARPLGQVRHISRAFLHPDGTQHHRLARLLPYGSDLWKAHYASRKNLVEGRNAQIARLGLKRVWSYGLAGATADITFADLLINLRTLGRLVQEATLPVT
jgi:hypothetical protein